MIFCKIDDRFTNMKRLVQWPIGLAGVLLVFSLTIGFTEFIAAAQKKEARVTQIIRDVRLLPSGASARSASLNDNVTSGTAVKTGGDSRTELTFTDQTLARLGANSIFTFAEGARNFDLAGGAMLLTAPGTAHVKIGSVSAAVTGFTALFEHHPRSLSKFIILHGGGSVSFKDLSSGPCRLHAGQMIVWSPHPTRCPEVLNVDLSKLLRGKLIAGFSRPLPEIDLILAEIENQKTSPPSGGYVDPTNIEKRDQSAAAIPTPPPIKPRTPGGP